MIERFGVTVDWRGATVEGIRTIAVEADRLGFGYIWIPEAWGLEAFATCGCVLSLTKNIKVGTGVVNVFSRSPSLIGMACCTLSQIGQGRFILGLGSSAKGVIESWHGISFEKPLSRTKDYIEIIRRVAGGVSSEYSGETVQLPKSKFRIFTKPVPKLEIYVGAIGDRNLNLASEYAEGAILATYPMSFLGHALSILKNTGKSREKKKNLFAYYSLRSGVLESDLLKARIETSKYIAFYIASMGKYYAQNLARAGYGEEVRAIVEAHGSGRDVSSAVSEKLLKDLAFVGTPVEIKERIASSIPEEVHPVFGVRASSQDDALKAVSSLRSIAKEL